MHTSTVYLNIKLEKDIKRNYDICKTCKYFIGSNWDQNVKQCWIVETVDDYNENLIHNGNIFNINKKGKKSSLRFWNDQGAPCVCKKINQHKIANKLRSL